MSIKFSHKLFALGATALLCSSCNAAASQDLSESIVRVRGSAMPGSGVVVRHNGNKAIVWTVAHVVGNPQGEVEITEANGKKTQAKIISFSKEKDIAILEFEPSNQYRNIKTTSARPEEDITVIGFPNRLNLNSNTLEAFKSPSGFIFGQWDDSKSKYNVAYKATTLPGMSGGGVFNDQGQLVAIHALKDIRQAETTFCYGGKLKDKGQIGLQCLSAPPKWIQNSTQTNKNFMTTRLLGSRGISLGRFDKSLNNTSSQQTIDIPKLLDSYQIGQKQSYALTIKNLPTLSSGKIKNLNRDQKLTALVFYNNFPQATTNTPSSPQYQEAILGMLTNNNRTKVDNLLIEAATTFGVYGRGLETQYGGVDMTKENYRKAERQWWKKYRQIKIDACIANGEDAALCDPLQHTSENINKRELFTAESLQRLESEINSESADSDTYIYAATNLAYSNKDVARALKYALKAEELGDQNATNLVEDLAKRLGDYEALLVSKYNRITAQLEMIATKPSLRKQATRNILGMLPLKELEATTSGCEIGEEIKSLLTTDKDTFREVTFDSHSYGQFTDALKTACSTKNQDQNTSTVASAPKTLQTLSDLGIKLPSTAKESMTLPTDIPGVVGQYATHPKNKDIEAIYQEITTSAKSNGFKLIKSLTRSGMPYSGGDSGCKDVGQKMCTAMFANNKYGQDRWFSLIITEMPGTDLINIQTSVIEALTKRDPLFKVIYD